MNVMLLSNYVESSTTFHAAFCTYKVTHLYIRVDYNYMTILFLTVGAIEFSGLRNLMDEVVTFSTSGNT